MTDGVRPRARDCVAFIESKKAVPLNEQADEVYLVDDVVGGSYQSKLQCHSFVSLRSISVQNHQKIAVILFWHRFLGSGAHLAISSGRLVGALTSMGVHLSKWFVRRNRGCNRVRAACQVSGRGRVRGRDRCENRKIFSW